MEDFGWQALVAILTTFAGYVIGKRKMDAETKKLSTENKIDEVELSDEVIDFYKRQMKDILKTVYALEARVKTMQARIDCLESNSCETENCPARKTNNKRFYK